MAEFGYFSEVRATCLRSLLHGGVEDVSGQNTGEEGEGEGDPNSSSQSSYSDMMIMGALALFAIIILKKNYSNTNNTNAKD